MLFCRCAAILYVVLSWPPYGIISFEQLPQWVSADALLAAASSWFSIVALQFFKYIPPYNWCVFSLAFPGQDLGNEAVFSIEGALTGYGTIGAPSVGKYSFFASVDRVSLLRGAGWLNCG